MKKEMTWSFVQQLRLGLIESWKVCLSLSLRMWLKTSFNLVNNLTPLVLLPWKNWFQKEVWTLEDFSWRYSNFLNVEYFKYSSLFNSITAEWKKEKKISVSVSCFSWHTQNNFEYLIQNMILQAIRVYDSMLELIF